MPSRRRPIIERIPLLLLTHPFELCLGLLLLAIAARAVLEGAITPSVDDTLPVVPRALYQAVSGLAGVAIIGGLTTRERWQPGRGIERAGMFLAAGAFIGYAIVLGNAAGWEAFVNVATAILIGVACILRGLAIRLSELIELRALKLINRDGRAS